MIKERITLSQPIEANSIETHELDMRSPTVADMLRMDKLKGSDAEKELQIIADLCEVAPKELEALVIADYVKLQKMFSAFFRSES